MKCVFCDKPAYQPASWISNIKVCGSCRRIFEVVRQTQAPPSTVEFVCPKCNFTEDVTGMLYHDLQSGIHEMRVDAQHNYCRNCGEPTKQRVREGAASDPPATC